MHKDTQAEMAQIDVKCLNRDGPDRYDTSKCSAAENAGVVKTETVPYSTDALRMKLRLKLNLGVSLVA